jgi:hypothetical protein
MSAIAYVCDSQMLEYHRICGHNSINFWRPSKGKRFESFNEGDLLFFLCRIEGQKHKEKGIVGYGRLVRINTLDLDQMWKRYRQLNGYETKIALSNAIIKANKKNLLPESIGCLLLRDVIFFQQPVYLSDIGYRLSKGIESFFYLDRIDSNATERVLAQANRFGVDSWSIAINSQINDSHIERDQIINLCVRSFAIGGYSKEEIKGIRRYCERIEVDVIIPKNAVALALDENILTVYGYFIGVHQQGINLVLRILGFVELYNILFKSLNITGITLKIVPVIGSKLSDKHLTILNHYVLD